MKYIKLNTVINRSAQQSFRYALNPNNTPRWVDGVVAEETNESPTKLGTIYRNQDRGGEWAEFEITAFEEGAMFEMTKKDDKHHVRYTFKPLEDNRCELEYYVWVAEGELSERFSKPNLEAIVHNLEKAIEAE